MQEISADKFIDVIQGLHNKLDDGFQRIYDRVTELEDDKNLRVAACNRRFLTIETRMTAADVANEIKKEASGHKRDTWMYIIRTIAVAGILAAFGFLWRIGELVSELHLLRLVK